MYTCKFSHSFYVVRLPVWCIKLSGAGVILRSHKFHNHLLCLLPLPVLYPLTVFPKSSPLHPLIQNMGNLYSRRQRYEICDAQNIGCKRLNGSRRDVTFFHYVRTDRVS